MSRAGSWLILIAALSAIVFQCFIQPAVGSADNGDFPKVTGWFSLGDPQFESNVAQFIELRYVFDAKYHYRSGFYSSEAALAAAAILVNRIFSQPGVFDLRVMGAIHAAVFLFSFWLIIPLVETMPRLRRYILLALIAGVFTDVAYVGYFNSFYMDTAGLLFFLLAVVAYLRASRWLLVVAAVLLLTSKVQHFALALPIAGLLAWRGSFLPSDRSRRFAAAALVLAAGAFSVRSAPSEYSAYGRYTIVFSQILPNSENPDEAMMDLGLDSSDRQYIGTHAYSLNAGVRDPVFTDQFRQRLTYVTLIRFFLTHPQDALRAIVDRLAEAGQQRPPRGNFPASAGLVGFSISHAFAVWSGGKARLFEHHGRLYFAYAILLGAVVPIGAALLRRRIPSGIVASVTTLAVMLAIELVVAGLGDALDAARHFLLFAAMSDVLLLTGVYLLLVAFEKPDPQRSASI